MRNMTFIAFVAMAGTASTIAMAEEPDMDDNLIIDVPYTEEITAEGFGGGGAGGAGLPDFDLRSGPFVPTIPGGLPPFPRPPTPSGAPDIQRWMRDRAAAEEILRELQRRQPPTMSSYNGPSVSSYELPEVTNRFPNWGDESILGPGLLTEEDLEIMQTIGSQVEFPHPVPQQ